MSINKVNLAIGCTLVATQVHVIAYTIPGWTVFHNIHIGEPGMWNVCIGVYSLRSCRRISTGTSEFQAKAMEFLALIAFLVSSGSAIALSVKKRDVFRKVMAYTAIAGGVFALIGVMILRTEYNKVFNHPVDEPVYSSYNYRLYYSFNEFLYLSSGLCIVGSIFGFAAGYFGLPHLEKVGSSLTGQLLQALLTIDWNMYFKTSDKQKLQSTTTRDWPMCFESSDIITMQKQDYVI